MKDKDIHHFSTTGDTKGSVVERFNRTLKSRMYRYFTSANTYKYLNVLQALVRGFNESFHRSIGMKPSEVTLENASDVWDTLHGKKLKQQRKLKPRFRVNDRVRLNEKSRMFKKGYLPGWTDEVFIVSNVVPGVVYTYDTPVRGTFCEQDLQKVQIPEDAFHRIEKVLKRQGNKVIVSWKGLPPKYNSWLNKKDIQKL